MAIQDAAGFNFLTDLDPVLSEIFFQKYRQITPAFLGPVFGVRASSKAKETHRRIGSFGDPQPWEGQVHYDAADPDYEIEWRHTTLTLGFKAERELLEDMQYDGFFTSAANLGQAFNRKVVKDEASVFNSAFAATGYDAQALVSASHPRSKTDATAVSNTMGTVALTDANLEAAIQKLEGLGDDRGEETAAMATHLIVGRANRQTALKLVGSAQEPGTANNAINTHTGLQVVVHPMISSKKWFVIDAPMAQMSMIWYWRLQAAFAADEDKSSTLVRSFFGRMRYSFGWQDFRWIVGSNAS